MRRLICSVAAFLSAAALCFAQDVLLRGKTANLYPFRYNGTYCWSTPSFEDGEVFFDGRLYEGLLLNVDAHMQQLLVRKSSTETVISPDRDAVAWFRKGTMFYVNLHYFGHDEVPVGFYAVFRDPKGGICYQQVNKKILHEIGNMNGLEGIGYEDPKYREDILTYFRYYSAFYVDQDGQFVKLRKGKARRLSRALRASGDIGFDEVPQSNLAPKDLPASAGNIRQSQALEHSNAGKELPAGWFSDGSITASQAAMLDLIDQESIIASYRNKTYEIGPKGKSSSGWANVSGCVHDVATGEALERVLVSDKGGKNYSYTDQDGNYSIKLPVGSNQLSFSEYSKEDMCINVIVHGNGSLDIVMKEKVTALQSAYVSAEGMAEHRRTKMGMEKIGINTVTHIPSAFGEGDVLKAVLTIPGVKTVGEASSGFNVRGGSTDQNLILFNGGTIYNPSHMFGIFSAFNTDVIDNIELYKSSIPVEYGGRISSVLDIKGKDGNLEKYKGSLGLGLLTSHFMVEGPLAKGKTSLILGGRTSYSDWLLNLLPKNSSYAGGRAGFSDLNVGLLHKFDERNSLRAYGYWSTDRFSFSGDTTFHYSNLNVALKYKHLYGEHNQMTISLGYDHYGNVLDNNVNMAEAYTLNTNIHQGFLKADFKEKYSGHTLSYGLDLVVYALDPGTIAPLTDSSLVVRRSLKLEKALEASVYLGDTWQLNDKFSADYGVRLSSFSALDPFKFYGGPEFRLAGKYSPSSVLSFKAGFNSMNQYIHLISNTSSISPMDTWKLSDSDIAPQRGWQAAAGVYWTVFGGQLDLSLEAYYKRMDNYLDYKSGAVLSMNEHLADDLVQTRGKSYGAELMAKKQTGRLTGWIAYTYSRAKLQEKGDRGIQTINRGEWYNAAHDKPHDVKIVSNYKFTHRYSISMNLDYSTGRPVTIPVGKYYYDGALRLAYSDRNSYRIPDYFRLDLAMNIEPGHYLKAFTHASCTFGCYNVTGRKNAYSVYYTTNGGTQINGYMISVFATQIPYISINLKF